MSSKGIRFRPLALTTTSTNTNIAWGTNNGPQSYSAATNVDGSIIYGYSQQTGGTGQNTQLLTSWNAGQIRNHGVPAGGLGVSISNAKRDGSVACGFWFPISGAFTQKWCTWTPNGGFNLNPIPTLASPWSWPYQINDISPDGSIIVATAGPDGDSSGSHAAGIAWTAAHGSVQLPLISGFTDATPTAISSDGTIIVGGQYNSTTSHACYWKTTDGGATWAVTDLGSLGVTSAATIAWDCTSNGTTIVGTGNPSAGVTHAWTWTSAAGMVDIGVPAGGHTWNTILVRACSESTSAPILTGLAFDNTASVQHTFTWTSAGGFTLLTPPAGGSSPDSNAISQDGTVVCGDTRVNGTRTVL